MKISKKILAMILTVVMSVVLSVSAFAAEIDNTTDNAVPVASSELVIIRDENGNVQFETLNGTIDPRIPGLANIVSVYVYDVDENHVKVSIQNIGLDWVDSVSMNIKIYNTRGLQYNKNLTETSIKQFLPRNNTYYVAGWNRIVISNIVVKDEGDVAYSNDIDCEK